MPNTRQKLRHIIDPYPMRVATIIPAALLTTALAIASTTHVASAASVDPGPSVSLAPVTKRSHCHVNSSLPDHACTPGAIFAHATKTLVCTRGYSRRVRNVSYAEKSAVYAEYGMHRHFNGHNGEVDHLVALELGGSNDQSNLWPEAAASRYGSHQKDRLENELHDEVCDGTITLSNAQRLIAGDWVTVYRSRFG
jgi:hypothetical protein